MTALRVVQVSGFRDPAGRSAARLLEAWPSLLDAARAARLAGAEVSVVQAAACDERLHVDGIDLHFVAERAWGQRLRVALASAPRVTRTVRALAPGVIHLHGLGFPLLARRLARIAPLLVQDHGDRPLHRLRPLQRWGLAAARGFAFTAAAQAEPFRRTGVLPADAAVFEILESTTRFSPGDAAALSGDPSILWIGRLMADKDPITFLDALALALPRLPGAEVWMAYGDAPMENDVRARIRTDPALEGRVHLLGRVPVDRVEALCRGADLYVSSSLREGSGYALLEAVACGATPVVTDIPAYRRILRGGAVGALVPPGDAPALADALAAAGSRPRNRQAVVAHSRAHLSLEAVGRELRAAYEAVAGGP